MMLDRDKSDIREKVIWFCSSCESANKITDLNCVDCGTPLKKGDTVFNIETFQAVVPENQTGSGNSPYWIDGGLSMRNGGYYAEWNER